MRNSDGQDTVSAGQVVHDDNPQTLAQNLYKQNIEILGKNKTLSLLSKLYAISILTLAPKDLAAKICETVQADLSFELVGILLFNQEKKELQPLAFASSERIYSVKSNLHEYFETLNIPLSSSSFLKSTIETKKNGYTKNLQDIWGNLTDKETFEEINSKGHTKSSMAFPLQIQDGTIGIFLLSFNRLFEELADYEKQSIESFANVIAVALDKALLYQQLKVANEELKSLDLARAEFISIASHQLRTPPATIKWYLSSVLSGDYGKIPGPIEEKLKVTQQTNNHLISLIEDMLNVSRIERGKMEFLFETTDTEELARFAYQQLIPIAESKKLKIEYEPPASPLPKVMADKEKLRQVMNNMIDNAIKYTKEGTVWVKILQKADNIQFQVKDSGKGISAVDSKSIFQKYARGKESIKQSAGLGLGLYVAKIIVEQHKGKIWAESEGEGKGSTFLFSIPIHNDLKQTTLVDLVAGQHK